MTPPLADLPIRSGQGDYRVTFAAALPDLVAGALADRPAALVVDRRVAALYAQALAPLLAVVPTHLVDATEDTKTLAGVDALARFFVSAGCNRRSRVLAIGGGIVQDLVCFTSHAFHRGMGWHFWPTTLLAMSDSCIGAKCGINVGETKNQLGVFHSPVAVAICPAFLDTLDERDLSSGYGEILKLLLTGPEAGMAKLERAVAAGGLRNPELGELIRDSLDVKRGVIEEDEYEAGLRQILNYGHTFGHALEAVTQHAVPHGLGVAWGIDVVNALAVGRGLLAPAVRERVRGFITRHLGFERPPVTAEALLVQVRRDKKAAAGSVTLAVLRAPGQLERVPTALDARLLGELTSYLASEDAFAPRGSAAPL